jgi:hypothetical protein
LNDQEKQAIGQTLSDWLYDHKPTKQSFVLIKVISALAVFIIKLLDQDGEAVQNFCKSTMQIAADRDPSLRIFYLKIVIQFLTFLPEEADKMMFAYTDGFGA